MASSYTPPLGLTIISSISVGVAALWALWILFDIIWRRGWKNMMTIMIPVYVINALYLWPITLWTYLKYGRPPKPGSKPASKPDGDVKGHEDKHVPGGGQMATSSTIHDRSHGGETDHSMHTHTQHDTHHAASEHDGHIHDHNDDTGHSQTQHQQHHEHQHEHGVTLDDSSKATQTHAAAGGHDMHAHMHGGGDMPMFANVTIAVCHCGAGCVLGDVVGEWIVYGSGTTIGGRDIWAEWIIDFFLALFFGIFFQYFSIAPATGEYGLRTVWRAATADFFSLVAFEVGLFGWMAIFQIGAFRWMLEMDTVTYWFMMQIGMFCGHWTAVPVNWWLLTSNIKVAIH